MDEESVTLLVAFGFILLGLFAILLGKANFGKTDGRTKTGYKDNVLPKPGLGCFRIIVGAVLVLVGIVGLMGPMD